MTIRNPAVAGAFYPKDPVELKSQIESFLEKAKRDLQKEKKLHPQAPKAILVPHAGYVYSGPVAAFAYSLIKDHVFKKIILIGPSHYVPALGPVADANDSWKTPLGEVAVMPNPFPKHKLAHHNEHCLEVQIPFLQVIQKDFQILPLVVGEASPKLIADKISLFLDKDTLLIISSDLSHYYEYKVANALDKGTIQGILSIDGEKTLDGEACGMVPILTVLELARMHHWKPELLCYKNSGDTSGDKGRVVGYAAIAFY